ncbi:MarC family protein [Candidatus Bathyarchaeota archaeon]|nr:MarC family protein [Candidatus Bathyarchaeota archaeon]
MLPDLTKSFISLFIIVDPFGNIPIFIGLTEGISGDSRRRIFHTATITGFILLLAFALAGGEILSFFGITLQSFMIAGGILLLIIAVRILVIGGWEERSRSPESIGVVPIAVPLLVGPGAITTTIINLETYGILTTIISVVLMFIIVWLTLRFIEPIYRVLGRSGSIVIARLMALLIAAIAVQFIIEGLENLPMEAP